MIFVLPTGHSDAIVHRMPWVTIAIAAICVFVQLYSSFGAPDRELAQAMERLDRIEYDVVDELSEEYEDLHPDDLLSEFDAGQLTEEDDPLLAEYRQAKEDVLAIQERHPIYGFGYRPARDGPLKMITSAFVHGGWFHLLGNLLFLYLVGCNLEDRWGRGWFAGFYLLGALVAAGTFWLWHPDADMPLVGASGAVSAAMGAFLVILWSAQIRFVYFAWILYFVRAGTFMARAYVALPLWFALQALSALIELYGDAGGVAYSAHVGGFLFGVGVGLTLKFTGIDAKLAERNEGEVVWTESETYQDAVVRAPENPIAAFRDYRKVLRERPDHAGSRHEIKRMLSNQAITGDFVYETEGLLADRSRAGRPGDVLDYYRTLQGRGVTFDDRTYVVVAQAAHTLNDAETVVAATRQLMKSHPDSQQIPRAMWDVAGVQEDAGRLDLARKTLQNLASAYSEDHFGQLARQRLNEIIADKA